MRGEDVPRDDRAWPRSSLPVSVALFLAATTTGVILGWNAAGRGAAAAVPVAAAFVVASGLGLSTSIPAMRHWVAGRPVPAWPTLVQGLALASGFVVLGAFDALVGGALIAGLMAGVLAANVWAIRTARRNRGLVDAAEAAAERDAAEAAAEGDARPPSLLRATAAQEVSVGQALRETAAVERRRALAWLVAGAVTQAGGIALGIPDYILIPVVGSGVLGFIWVLRRLWAVWLAVRNFTRATKPPRRAFVVLLHDPAPRMVRPLLGVWSAAPARRDGRLPKPERVYRCDEERDALASYQGSAVVHEAWVGTRTRRWGTPRWVTADAGLALPHGRSVFGRWYLSNLLSGERPGPPQPLTLPPPHPDRNAIVEEQRAGGSFLAAVAGRLAALAALGLLIFWFS